MATKDLATTLEELILQYNNTPTYTPKTEAELKAQAEGEYKSYYDQLRLTAQQQQAQSDLALQQQAAGLQATYDKQREASEKNYAQQYSQADRGMLARGMQRSSYAAQTLANISQQGVEAQQAIADQQAAAEGNIAAQRAQLAQQLAQQLSQYDANEAADVLSRIRELEDQEYQRGMTSVEYKNSLSSQIYQLLYQQERDKIADEQWQKQFDESVRQYEENKKKKSSSSSSNTTTQTAATVPGGYATWEDFFNALNGGSSSGSANQGGSIIVEPYVPQVEEEGIYHAPIPRSIAPSHRSTNRIDLMK